MKAIHNICPLALLCILIAVSSVLAQDAAKKDPLPAEAAQAEATKLVKEVYGDEYAKAATANQKQALAGKLLEKANETKDDPAGQFVLLRLAKDIATQANDNQMAFDAIDRMAAAFQVDANEMKMAVLSKLASAAQNPAQHKSIAERALKLMEDAITFDNYTVADQLAVLALVESRKNGDPALISNATARQDDVSELAKAYQRANGHGSHWTKRPMIPRPIWSWGNTCALPKATGTKGCQCWP